MKQVSMFGIYEFRGVMFVPVVFATIVVRLLWFFLFLLLLQLLQKPPWLS